jgi:hypothetical protein
MTAVEQTVASGPAMLREFPHPYRAMLAICSDLDETPGADAYFEVMKFLNTTEETSMGPGVGLEVGNTIYFDMPAGHFSYWSTTDENREKIRELIRSGHIDCIHSFGDLANSRAHAGRALEEMERHGCRIRTWVDHAQAPTNFGADIMQGHGDEAGHACYHSDLTCDYGVEYVWRGRVTSIIGQNRRASYRGIASRRHLVASAKTLLKEAIKRMSARIGGAKYSLHLPNRILRPARLRDGRRVKEFLRCNPHWSGVSGVDTADGLAEVLTPAFLDRLLARGASSIIYTHIGKTRSSRPPLPPPTVAALRLLGEYHRAGKICVTTTTRLLDWCSQTAPKLAWKPLVFPQIHP